MGQSESFSADELFQDKYLMVPAYPSSHLWVQNPEKFSVLVDKDKVDLTKECINCVGMSFLGYHINYLIIFLFLIIIHYLKILNVIYLKLLLIY